MQVKFESGIGWIEGYPLLLLCFGQDGDIVTYKKKGGPIRGRFDPWRTVGENQGTIPLNSNTLDLPEFPDLETARAEKKATMAIALPDADAEIEPVLTSAQGRKPEPEMDRLSNIVKALKCVITALFSDDAQLFKQFQDNESFRRWLTDTVFGMTYDEQEREV
jgi:hypothetical protein